MPSEVDQAWIERLTKQTDEVLTRWEAQVRRSHRAGRVINGLADELRAVYESLVEGLRKGGAATSELGEVRALLTELSASRARQGFTPSETATSIFALKSAIKDVIGVDDVDRFVELSQLIDDLGLFTFESFVSARENVIANQAEQLLELSTPVIKLWDGIVAVPLVGTLDSARTQVVMETLLQTLIDTGSEHAIIDITGVAAVDTQVAQHLLKTVVAARLMGAECIISGIRPQIAQTVVALGIEFGDIPTKATLADALRHVLRQAGFEIVRGAADRNV
jgi:rsbT co-antagonist protein RsbR